MTFACVWLVFGAILLVFTQPEVKCVVIVCVWMEVGDLSELSWCPILSWLWMLLIV